MMQPQDSGATRSTLLITGLLATPSVISFTAYQVSELGIRVPRPYLLFFGLGSLSILLFPLLLTIAVRRWKDVSDSGRRVLIVLLLAAMLGPGLFFMYFFAISNIS